MGMPGMGGSAEELSSHNQFTFSKMQSDLWESARDSNFLLHKTFMQSVLTELNDDPEAKVLFFQTIFDKMHLQLTDIKQQSFSIAESNTEYTKILLEFEGAAEVYVNSP